MYRSSTVRVGGFVNKSNRNKIAYFDVVRDLLGIKPHVGILVRMSDKLSRLGSFTQKGFLAVNDESVEDTLLDLANYSLLCLMEYRKDKEVKA